MYSRWFIIFAIIVYQNQSLNSNEIIESDSLIKINVTEYPVLEKNETFFDKFHGEIIYDPYRYLEDTNSKETRRFIERLNEITDSVLNQSKYRDIFREKVIKYRNYEQYGIFEKYGDYYYYTYNSGIENHDSIYRKQNLNDTGEKFLDVDSLSKEGLISCSFTKTSLDGKIMAYGLSVNGSDWNTIHFINEYGEPLPDILYEVKDPNVDFILNNTGFIYSSYPNKNVTAEGKTIPVIESHSLYYHKMGTEQDDDIIIADYPENKNFLTFGSTSNDGRFLFVNFFDKLGINNSVYYYDLYSVKNEITKKLDLKPLFDKPDANYQIFDSNDDEVFVMADKNASMEGIFKMKFPDSSKSESDLTILVDEDKVKPILGVSIVGKNYFIVHYLEGIKSSLFIHDKENGEMIQEIDLEAGFVEKISGSKESNEFFVSFSSQISPSTIYRGNLDDLEKGEKVKLEIIKQTTPEGLDLSEFTVKQVFYQSKDGTHVHMLIFYKKNIKLDGNNPVLLEGYGFSNIPSYSASKTMFVKHFNGIVCTANIRGGGQFGEKWSEDGILHKKQNAFDDFIAAAEYLIKNNYTRPSKLGIIGGSNGGLLVAVVSQQRPDLFGVVINQAGILDMVRFHRYTFGGLWISEYGNPDEEDDFKYIIKYSPLHNLRLPPKPIQWPSTFLVTADHDNRVDPAHTLKYIATLYEILQEAKDYQTNPVLALIEKSAGHGDVTPLSKIIDAIVKVFSFLQLTLNLSWKD